MPHTTRQAGVDTSGRQTVSIQSTASARLDRQVRMHIQTRLIPDQFIRRHIGPSDADISAMLAELEYQSLDELIDATIPENIRLGRRLDLPSPLSESEALEHMRSMASKNRICRSMLGMGYHGTITPPVIQRHILENPLWYTPYTPYQAEIAQGRLEALLNFQTMICDMTGLPVANASLLDESTAAAEAMAMCWSISRCRRNAFYVADDCHPQTIAVLRTRAWSIGLELHIGPASAIDFNRAEYCGLLLQYPTTDGRIEDYTELAGRAHDNGALVVVAADLLALAIFREPGEFGTDIAVGTTQRFGVPMGYGGPHAAYMATRNEYIRKMPGRIVGISKDSTGKPACRLAIQTREQHIKREKATSNICTAQVLLAVMAGMYAVYHGPDGLRRIAWNVRRLAHTLAAGLRKLGHEVPDVVRFDTVTVTPKHGGIEQIVTRSIERGVNLFRLNEDQLAVTLDETTGVEELKLLIELFSPEGRAADLDTIIDQAVIDDIPLPHRRESRYLTHPVFNRYHSEHELLRYITRLQSRDISLADSMIPLGSCTMKLNAAAEMMPVTWQSFSALHPFATPDQTCGYEQLMDDLDRRLAEITGLASVSFQPNAGSQGEYTGLLVIRAWHESRTEAHRRVCLIPTSAHGTNPASAVMAGYDVVTVNCDQHGNVDIADLADKIGRHRDTLGALMITYPSTHGVFESAVVDICRLVHEAGGQVYMDGANMNAQVGLCRPGDIGADVCHLNLHKTFSIPHGGGGPGAGPIAVAEHLVPFLPAHPLDSMCSDQPGSSGSSIGPVASAPFGSPSILPISWMYIAMMGADGLALASKVAILSANYMAHRLAGYYDVLYTGRNGRVAHEFIIDCRGFEKSAGVRVDDIAKWLMDYGFQAPTMSFPVPGTLMIEPTETESREELDRFCDAMIAIRGEIEAIETGRLDPDDNPLRNAPHTAEQVSSDQWSHSYSREQAAYPLTWLRERKYWPPVSRIDNPYGDRNLICACPPVGALE